MLKWIWEHILWGPRRDVRAVQRTQLLEVVLELRTRVGALELDLAKLRGRVVGGLRGDTQEAGMVDVELDDVDDSAQEDLELEIDPQDLELEIDPHALGARRRFGKG